jgi:hypothetical protein
MWDFVSIWVRESVGLTFMELDSRGISSETGVENAISGEFDPAG